MLGECYSALTDACSDQYPRVRTRAHGLGRLHMFPLCMNKNQHYCTSEYQAQADSQVCALNRAPHVGREVDRGADRDAPPPRERREEPPPRPRERERERPANGHRDSFRERDAAPR